MIKYREKTGNGKEYKVALVFEGSSNADEIIHNEIRELLKTKATKALKQRLKF